MNNIFRLYITSKAFSVIDSFLSKRNQSKILRIGVRGGQGCCGFKYFIECAEYVSPTGDVHLPCNNNVHIVVDTKSARLINGSIIQWIENQKESGLKLKNPKTKQTCSCGQSFST